MSCRCILQLGYAMISIDSRHNLTFSVCLRLSLRFIESFKPGDCIYDLVTFYDSGFWIVAGHILYLLEASSDYLFGSIVSRSYIV